MFEAVNKIRATNLQKLVILLGGLCVSATVATFLARWIWVCELICHFRVQLILGTLAFTVLCAAVKNRRTSVVLLCCAAWHLWTISDCYLPLGSLESTTAANPKISAPIRVYSTNVLTSNKNYSTFIDRIKDADPDVIVIIEVDEIWLKALTPLHDLYPYRVAEPSPGNFGIAVFSRLPMEQSEVIQLKAGIPCIVTKVSKPEQSIRLFGVHVLPPSGRINASTRNQQLAGLAKLTAADPTSVLVGDLNCTPWSPFFDDLLNNGNLRNTQSGRGLQPSWPDGNLLLQIPIDHALIGPKVDCLSRRLDKSIGSDHLPVIIEVQGGSLPKETAITAKQLPDCLLYAICGFAGTFLLAGCLIGWVKAPKKK